MKAHRLNSARGVFLYSPQRGAHQSTCTLTPHVRSNIYVMRWMLSVLKLLVIFISLIKL